MAYRLTKRAREKYAAMGRASQAAQARKRLEQHPPDYPPELPELRRVIEITDYDSGTPVVYRMELKRTDRIDCYDAYINGELWKRRVGWSRVLQGIRKALPRLRAMD